MNQVSGLNGTFTKQAQVLISVWQNNRGGAIERSGEEKAAERCGRGN